MHVEHGRCFFDARHLLLDGSHVVGGEVVGGRHVGGGAGDSGILGPDDVGADVLDLGQHIAFTGECDVTTRINAAVPTAIPRAVMAARNLSARSESMPMARISRQTSVRERSRRDKVEDAGIAITYR